MIDSRRLPPADLLTLVGQLITNAYSHLGEVIQLPTGHPLMRAPKNVPAILWKSNREVPLISASRNWARLSVVVVTYAHEGHLVLSPRDLQYTEAESSRIHPGYLDPAYEGLNFRVRQSSNLPMTRECGLYRAKHWWQASLLIGN
ncbi:hypothetical protein AB0B97_29805 [Micromonospora sp. NPDC049004]|uniref:hypothetical protein n=1 Tax=Micromonospora sp. NPDC049004 TaxID=3154348 RepID=UPI0033CF0051